MDPEKAMDRTMGSFKSEMPKVGPKGNQVDVFITDNGTYRIEEMWWVSIKIQGRTTPFTFRFKPNADDLIQAIQISGKVYNWQDYLVTQFIQLVKKGQYRFEKGKILNKD